MDADDIKVHATADGRRWPPTETAAEANESASTVAETPTSTDDRRWVLDKITERIIGCVHRVSKILGAGFLEKVYENALALELRQCGLELVQQHRIEVRYRDTVVGDFVADVLVERCIVVEVKAVKALDDIHSAQCLNYLRATGLQVCLLINFGTSRATVKRIVHDF